MDRREDRAKQHSRALEIIAIQPEAFGFENTSDIALEITLPENGRAITETDIKLVMANGDLYLVEFKLSSANKYKRRARQQLEKARGWYRRHMGIPPDKIYTRVIFRKDYADFFKDL